MAILAELGAPRLSAVLGVEHEQVSLAACNLLHVMFDSLKEGLQKDFRGKEDAVVLGECLPPWLAGVGWGEHSGEALSCNGLVSCCPPLSLLPAAEPGLWSRANMRLSWEAGAPCHGSSSCQPYHGKVEACAQGADSWALSLLEDSSKDLKLLIKHLLELLALEGASAHGRDNALNLLIKVVPRKSLKETNNSMSLWVIDQGEQNSLQCPAGASCLSASGCCVPRFHLCTPFCS